MTISDLSIIIPVFNGWKQTERCLRSLEGSSFKDFTVIIVDHGSTDGTKTQLPRLFPGVVHLIESEELWWTGATNAGIRHALAQGATKVMLLNNDCEISTETLQTLVDQAATGPGIVTPVQRSIDTGAVLFAGAASLITLGFPTLFVRHHWPAGRDRLLRTSMIAGGRGVLIQRDVFETVGFFEEQKLPHYLADHDFYLRCRDAGIPLWVATDATVLVDETRTSVASDLSGMSWSGFRNSLRNPRSHRNLPALAAFFRRNYPIRSLWWIGTVLNVSRYAIRWALARSFALITRTTR